MPNTEILLRELNHRVKNNLQIIVSLINLKKRLLAPERRDDIRFIEEHVQAMAVAYRLVYATGEMNEVSVGELLGEVVSELRQIAKLSAQQIQFDSASIQGVMGLDQAIALGLYLAVILPPYLDCALRTGSSVRISAWVESDLLTLAVAGTGPERVEPDFLRSRLSEAYADQLQAENLSSPDLSEWRIRFHLDDRRLTISPSIRPNAPAGEFPPESP